MGTNKQNARTKRSDNEQTKKRERSQRHVQNNEQTKRRQQRKIKFSKMSNGELEMVCVKICSGGKSEIA